MQVDLEGIKIVLLPSRWWPAMEALDEDDSAQVVYVRHRVCMWDTVCVCVCVAIIDYLLF